MAIHAQITIHLWLLGCSPTDVAGSLQSTAMHGCFLKCRDCEIPVDTVWPPCLGGFG